MLIAIPDLLNCIHGKFLTNRVFLHPRHTSNTIGFTGASLDYILAHMHGCAVSIASFMMLHPNILMHSQTMQ